MPYFPTQPLLPRLRAQVDVGSLGPGGYRSGIERLVEMMADRFDSTDVRSYERLLRRILHGEVTQVREQTADRLATVLGVHPVAIWVDWYEVTERRCTSANNGSGRR